MPNGKTIEIFLPSGNPKGIKRAKITTGRIEVIQSSKKDFLENKDLFDFPGVYILIDSLQENIPNVYIGKGKIKQRLENHVKNKDFWNLIFAIKLESTEGFNESHTSYMEYYLIDKAKKINRAKLEDNKQNPKPTNLKESIICEIHDYLEVAEILLSTLGVKFLQDATEGTKKNHLFTCENKSIGAGGNGIYTEDGFTVLKGAMCRLDIAEGTKDTPIHKFRDSLVVQGILKQKNGFYLLTQNYTFPSPSTAAAVVLARNANGWTEWKNSDKQTLDDIYRKK